MGLLDGQAWERDHGQATVRAVAGRQGALNQEALEAAQQATRPACAISNENMEAAIRAYLTALAPADNGLVERLRVHEAEWPNHAAYYAARSVDLISEAADTIMGYRCNVYREKARAEAAESRLSALEPLLDKAVGWRPLTCNDNVMTCPLPADETVIEVMLNDGTICRAWYSCNIMDAGDWDFMPVKDDGDPDDEADSIAAKVVAWRTLTAIQEARHASE